MGTVTLKTILKRRRQAVIKAFAQGVQALDSLSQLKTGYTENP